MALFLKNLIRILRPEQRFHEEPEFFYDTGEISDYGVEVFPSPNKIMISTVEELIEHVEDPNDVHDESQLMMDGLTDHIYENQVQTITLLDHAPFTFDFYCPFPTLHLPYTSSQFDLSSTHLLYPLHLTDPPMMRGSDIGSVLGIIKSKGENKGILFIFFSEF